MLACWTPLKCGSSNSLLTLLILVPHHGLHVIIEELCNTQSMAINVWAMGDAMLLIMQGTFGVSCPLT